MSVQQLARGSPKLKNEDWERRRGREKLRKCESLSRPGDSPAGGLQVLRGTILIRLRGWKLKSAVVSGSRCCPAPGCLPSIIPTFPSPDEAAHEARPDWDNFPRLRISENSTHLGKKL